MDATQKEQATEFSRRRNLPGAYVEHLDGGKRSMTVVIKVNGVQVASKTTVYKRGKVSSELYILPAI